MQNENQGSTGPDHEEKKELFAAHVHRPALKFSHLMRTTGRFDCETCGEPIAYNTLWSTISRVWYYLLLAYLIYTVLSQKAITSDEMVRNFALMLGVIILYIIGAAAMNRWATFEIDEQTIAAKAKKQADLDRVAREKAQLIDEPDESAELTAEQAELQALYKHYEQLNAEANGTLYQSSESSAAAALTLEENKRAECSHEIIPSWKNYTPGMMDFKCVHCGAKLSFSAESKKRANMLFMVLSLVLLYPMLNMDKVSFLGFVGLSVLVLVVATILQYFLLKRVKLEVSK